MWQRTSVWVFVMVALAGCAGGLEAGTSGDGGRSGNDAAADVGVVLGCARARTILGGCLACHSTVSASANGGFDMEKTGWGGAMVGKGPAADAPASSECKGRNLVFLEAGALPARGLFLDKLKLAMPACGVQMPKLLTKLGSADLTCVQEWANGLVAGGTGD